jgi:hypothetical protein
MKKLTRMTYLLLEINSALDTGKYNDISIENIRNQAEQKKLVEYLKNKLGEDVDLSLLEPEDINELNNNFADISIALYNRERKKLGIENNGLCLIIGYLIVMIQQSKK